jgi:predicted CxxxxCH...CXXCH cytochrome family protein
MPIQVESSSSGLRHEVTSMMRTRGTRVSTFVPALAVAALVVFASACGGGGQPAPAAGGPTKASHALSSGTNCPETGVHAKHLNYFACSTCHPKGGAFGFEKPYTFTDGTTTAGGTIALGGAGVATTCTVACHFPKGAPSKTVAWDAGPQACVDCHAASALPQDHPAVAPNATRADCQKCHITSGHLGGTVLLVAHDSAWMDPASPTFHAVSANEGLGPCQGCHGADLAGGASKKSCGSCHDVNLPAGVASWKVSCTMCHGDAAANVSHPPRATWGNEGDPVRVGAHTAHAAGSAIAPAYDCGVCHVKPADALSGGHLDGGTAEVPFGGIALSANAQPRWDRATATCANVYCHGATLSGGTKTAPLWTGTSSEAACGTCHGVPPPSPHPTAAAGLTGCTSCHPETIDSAGNLIAPAAGGKHLDGIVEATGGHPDSWMDTTSSGFHAYAVNAGLAACTACHGANLDGVGGTTTLGCNPCHGSSWRTNCTMCHGDAVKNTPSPPQGTWGHESDPLRVGAHAAHLAPKSSVPVACTGCHIVPTDALASGHVDTGRATLTFGGLAVNKNTAAPTWDGASCSNTYCHGNFTGLADPMWGYPAVGGRNATPLWSGAKTTCTSCHDNPPGDHYVLQPGAQTTWVNHAGCADCHPDVDYSGTVITNPTLHVNGRVETLCAYCH